MVPAGEATRRAQRVAPDEVIARRTASWLPSPLGEIRVVDAEAALTVGATVSTVTPNAATWASVVGRLDGAWNVRPPARPTSCRT